MTSSTPESIAIDGRVVLRPGEDLAAEGAVVHRVTSGRAQLFAVETGLAEGRRHPLLTLEVGDLVFPASGAAGAAELTLVVSGLTPAVLAPVSLDALEGEGDGAALAAAVERWVDHLAAAAGALLPPGPETPVAVAGDGPAVDLRVGQEVCGPSHGAVWFACAPDGLLFEVAETTADAGLPLTRATRLKPLSDADGVRVRSTEAMIADGAWRTALDAFHRTLFASFAMNLALAVVDEYNRHSEQAEEETRAFSSVLRRAGEAVTLDGPTAPIHQDGDDPVRMVVARIAETVRGDGALPPPIPGVDRLPVRDRIVRTLASAGLASRPIRLTAAVLTGQGQPAITVRSDGTPLAFLPRGRRGTAAYDPVSGTTMPVDAALLDAVEPRAFSVSPTLPDHPVGLGALLRLVFRAARSDVVTITLQGLAAAVLALLPVILLGAIIGAFVPNGDLRTVVELGLVLVAVGFAVAACEFLKGLALVRAESMTEMVAQPAVFHRLLGLPVSFFRARPSGDITQRVLGIGLARRLLGQGAVLAVLAAAFASVNLIVMAVFSPPLTAIAILVLAVIGGIAAIALRRAYAHETRALEIDGTLTDTALRLVRSVDKVRVAGAERRAFVRWYALYVDKRRKMQSARAAESIVATLATVAPVGITTAVIAAAVVADPDLSATRYAVFGAALANLLIGLQGVVGMIPPTFAALILIDRMRPLLAEAPERVVGVGDPGPLVGHIQVNGVSLSYREGAPVLSDLSLTVEPGSFVALVGPSGAGKSSLLKVMLGLETPSGGSVFYDGQDLARLDKAAVRKQFGVVMQDGMLLPGSILENLRASASVGEAEAWAALREAGLEGDVRAMPMGIHTFVAEGSTLSGGQRQRLMLARALVRKPRILFLDEATSALDEQTQAEISANLERLTLTRIAVAHRLSTIRNADMIHVIVGGRITEQGTFDELMRTGPAFQALARRQIA